MKNKISISIFAIVLAAAVPFISHAGITSIVTLPASAVSPDSAVLSADVVENYDTDSFAWFEYGTSISFGSETPHQRILSFTSDTVTYALHGLQPNTTYYYRAAAQDSVGTTTRDFVNIQSFTTSAAINSAWNYGSGNNGDSNSNNGNSNSSSLPGVITNTAYSENPTSATLDAYIRPNGTTAIAWFEYGTNYNLGTTVGNKIINVSDTNYDNQVDFSYTLTNLQPDTLYYYQAVAQNQNGTQRGNLFSFRTAGTNNNLSATRQPSVTTSAAMFIRENSALLNGVAVPNNSQASAWFEWSENADFSASRKSEPRDIGSGNSEVYLAYSLTGLTVNKTYYFRAVAQNALGATFGGTMSFTAKPYVKPVVTAPAAPSAPSAKPAVTQNATSNLLDLEAEFSNSNPRPGSEMIYAVSYQNVSEITLKNTVLNITLPDEAGYKNSNISDVNQNVNSVSFKIGDLAAKQSGIVSIRVKITKDTKAESIAFKAVGTYSANGKNGSDEITSNLDLNYTPLAASVIDLLKNLATNFFVDILLGIILGIAAYRYAIEKNKKVDAGNPLN